MHYWKDKRFYWATSYTAGWNMQLSFSCDGPQTGKQFGTVGCSRKLHFKHCRDPDTDLGLPKYILIHLSTTSYLRSPPKKADGDISPLCHCMCWHPCLSGCQPRHDCSWLVLLWCGVTYSCYYKYGLLLKPSVLQTVHLCNNRTANLGTPWRAVLTPRSDLSITLNIIDWNCSHIQHLLPQALSLSVCLFYTNH